MVGDGTQLRTSEVATALNVSASTVINYLRDGLLRATWTAGGHRRVDAASVTDLTRVLAVPPGPDRDTAMDELRRRNRNDSGPDPEGPGREVPGSGSE